MPPNEPPSHCAEGSPANCAGSGTQSLSNAVASICDQYTDYLAAVKGCLTNCLSDGTATHLAACECVKGCVANYLDLAASVYQSKCCKVVPQIVGLLGEAYAKAQVIGCDIPSAEELDSRLASCRAGFSPYQYQQPDPPPDMVLPGMTTTVKPLALKPAHPHAQVDQEPEEVGPPAELAAKPVEPPAVPPQPGFLPPPPLEPIDQTIPNPYAPYTPPIPIGPPTAIGVIQLPSLLPSGQGPELTSRQPPTGGLTSQPRPQPPEVIQAQCPPEKPPTLQPRDESTFDVSVGVYTEAPKGFRPDICGHWEDVRKYLVAVGKAFIESGQLKIGLLTSLVFTTKIIPGDHKKELDDYVESLIGWKINKYFEDELTPALCQMQACNGEELTALYVLRDSIAFAESIRIVVDQEVGVKTSGEMGTGFHVPIVGGVEVKQNADAAQHFALASELHTLTFALKQMVEYAIRLTVPLGVPSIGDAINGYLRGRLPSDDRDCLIRLNNGDPALYSSMIVAASSRVREDQVIDAIHRGIFTPEVGDEYLASVGVLDDNDRITKFNLSYNLPPAGEITRWYVHGVLNNDNVEHYGLDEGFDEFKESEAYSVMKGLHYADNHIQMFYRADHRPADFRNAINFYHQLRPDKPGIEENDLTFDEDELDRYLRMEGLTEYWRSRFKAVAHVPLNMRILRLVRRSGTLTDDEVISAIQDNGYSRDNAQTILTAFDFQTKRELEGSKWIEAYAKNGIGRSDVVEQLTNDGFSQPMIDEVLARADRLQQAAFTEKCVEALNKRYLLGGFSDDSYTNYFVQLGLDPSAAMRTLRLLQCERGLSIREERGTELCKWFQSGLLSATEFSQRLTDSGYRDTDAARIVSLCNLQLQQRLERESERLSKQIQSQRDRVQKQLEREATLLENKAAKQQRLQLSIAKVRRAHEAAITKLAEAVAKLNQSTIEDAGKIVSQVYSVLLDELGFEPDEAYRIITLTSKALPKTGPIDLESIARGVASTWKEAGDVVPTNGVAGEPSGP